MKIVWTDFAIRNLKDIFDCYSTRVNKKVAHKIRLQILKSSRQLKYNPNSGSIDPNLISLNKNHRYLISGYYKLIYRVVEDKVVINDVFDTRQDPSKMIDEKRKTK
ncbi:type II toxin-antitoxin system RelE/ParE family toxin [Belliella sp. DSM 107340]|uniref:Type II toxin-antitoxin system RelE/ParE family toxin n=1 Tax=Belliella calami TaxID=2923436 RepID=A0ABS9ULR9_9BACT|nr:type II toxin-antitoxin system RelE/ParE family toxin [Belliella calami]MCH7397567.1 type II toxin-antitoxin system RelE/ParE family toxin [Belliella calami]